MRIRTKKGGLSTNYYIADTHFGHANILRHCGRPFLSVEEMDGAMMEAWRSRVREEDAVYILGDLMFYCKDPERYLRRLTGRKHLIVGNHDAAWMKKVCMEAHFASVQNMLEVRDGENRMTLCHYPLMTWNGAAQGSYMIFGHIHNNAGGAYWPLLWQTERALNAGVDINGFAPVTLEALIENNRRFRAEHPARRD